MTNKINSVLYIGVTNNLIRRVQQHKNKTEPKSFTARYNVNKLVYYEETDNVESALNREKQLKRWHRKWKNNLIHDFNPNLSDLSLEWL